MGNGIAGATVAVWAFFIAIIAIIFALSAWNLLPFTLTVAVFNSLLLFLLAGTLFTETVMESKVDLKNPLVLIELAVAVVAVIVGISILGYMTLPAQMLGVLSIFYLILAGAVIAEIRKVF